MRTCDRRTEDKNDDDSAAQELQISLPHGQFVLNRDRRDPGVIGGDRPIA